MLYNNLSLEIPILFGIILGTIFGILLVGWILSEIPTFKFKLFRGFEAFSSLATPYYKGVKKEELKDWDSAATTVRKSQQ